MKITLFITTLLFSFQMSFSQEMSENMKVGTDHFGKKEFELALKCFLKEDKKNPSTNVSFWLGHTYAELNQIDEAKSIFLKIVQSGNQGSEYAMSLVNLGNCYRSLKLNDSAYFYYDRAITEFPKMASGYFNKGQLLYSESKFTDAKIHFDKAIEIEPNDWFNYQKRLEVCFASKDYECALQDLLAVRRLNTNAKNEMNLAFCYTMLEKYEEADSIFQMIYKENDAFFLNNYGMNKHNMGQTAEGKKLIQKSLSINPNNSFAYRNLAVIALSEGDEIKACEYLQKAKSFGFENQYGTEVEELIIKHCK
jgi:tetratricopeptide (TPR) repeat protein